MNAIKKGIAFYKDVNSKKEYFPKEVLNWQLIGKYAGQFSKILGKDRVQKLCDKRHRLTREFLVSEFRDFLEGYEFVENKEPNSKIIWTLWLQGYEQAPEIVKVTLDNIQEYAKKNDFEFKLLDEKTLHDYIKFPDYIIKKIEKGILTHTGLADMLRVALLAEYGGTWIDSTVLIKEDFDKELLLQHYFTLKTGEMEDFSPNVSKNRWKTFLLSGNSPLYSFTRDFFFEYYKKFDYQVDYLLIDYIFDLAFVYSDLIKQEMTGLKASNPKLFWLEKNLGNKYDVKKWQEMLKDTTVFKTTYKLSDDIKKSDNNFYHQLVKRGL